MKRFKACIIFTFAFILLFSLTTSAETVSAPESSLYREIRIASIEFSKEDSEAIDNLLQNGWQNKETIKALISRHEDYLNKFKEATDQQSDGDILWEKAVTLDANTTYQENIRNDLKLFKLLLLQAKIYEDQQIFTDAGENYIAATRFILHLSQQNTGCTMAVATKHSSLSAAYFYLEQSLKNASFPTSYRNQLRSNLIMIKAKQDFLECALREEAELMKGTARLIEESSKKGTTFRELFVIGEITQEEEKFYQRRSKELNDMLDSEFFQEFYKEVEEKANEFTENMIVAAKSGDPKRYEEKYNEYQAAWGSTKPYQGIGFIFKQMFKTKKEIKAQVARLQAKIVLLLGSPKLTLFVEKEHLFSVQLNNLIQLATQ